MNYRKLGSGVAMDLGHLHKLAFQGEFDKVVQLVEKESNVTNENRGLAYKSLIHLFITK